MRNILRFYLVLILALAGAGTLRAATVSVNSLPALQRAIAAAVPGDRIVVAGGVYDSPGEIDIAIAGAAGQPLTIMAEKIGGVEIKGEGGFTLESPAAYVVIEGFKFTHAPGTLTLAPGVHHCRISRNVFELAGTRKGAYLQVSGDDNEISYNTFQNKHTEGQMISVQGQGSSGMAQRTWIHHNYFHDFRPSSNNCGAIQVGLSGRSLSPAHTLVECNLFVKTAGENEGCVCNKSCENTYRFNTFGEGGTELSLRHGNRCQVYGNFFLGTNGIRFCGDDHRIFSNYFERCRPAINIANGDGIVPKDKLTSHDRPDRVVVAFNTMVNNNANIMMAGRRNGLGATQITIANNIIVGGGVAATIAGPLKDPVWSGNIIWGNQGGAGAIPEGGYLAADPKLLSGKEHWRLQPDSPAIGKAVGEFPYVNPDIDGQARDKTRKDVGADQLMQGAATNRILTVADVGPEAPAPGAVSK